jgi:RimJ/RimL family protein N-acetyltransferase
MLGFFILENQVIVLEPMTETEFCLYRQRLIREYAAEKVRAGNWSAEESLSRSEQEIDQLLPDGLRTKEHNLFSIRDTGLSENLGILWFAVVHWSSKPSAFVYDIEIEEALRGKGYGTQALMALEEQVKTLGIDTIRLNVFGYNHAARALYAKLGYEITNINMAKKLA